MVKNKIVKERVVTIGLVDDHGLFRDAIARMLNKSRDMEVTLQAESGERFLELVEQYEIPDIVVVDVGMKGMSGYKLTSILYEKYPSAKVIALSMYQDETAVIRMLRNGARTYLLKGCSPNDLREAIRSVYCEGMFANNNVSKPMLDLIGVKKDKRFSEVEIEFLKFCCQDISYKEIANKMNVSHRTVDGYRDRLFEKTGARSRIGLAMFAVKNGIYSPEL